jgi:hypothetical protein
VFLPPSQMPARLLPHPLLSSPSRRVLSLC